MNLAFFVNQVCLCLPGDKNLLLPGVMPVWCTGCPRLDLYYGCVGVRNFQILFFAVCNRASFVLTDANTPGIASKPKEALDNKLAQEPANGFLLGMSCLDLDRSLMSLISSL